MKPEKDPEVAAPPPQHLEDDLGPSKDLAATKELDVGAQVLGGEGDIEYTEEGERFYCPSFLWSPVLFVDEKHRGRTRPPENRLAHYSVGRLGLRAPIC